MPDPLAIQRSHTDPTGNGPWGREKKRKDPSTGPIALRPWVTTPTPALVVTQ